MDTNLGYLAGFFDGEGSITIQRRTGNHCWFRLFVVIASNDKPIIDSFRECWSGHLKEISPGIRQHGETGLRIARATSYRLTFAYDEVELFLIDILPHLRLKQKQAELALKFLDAYKNLKPLRSRGSPGGLPYTPIEIETYTRLYNEMKNLNSNNRDRDSIKELRLDR